MLAPFLAIVFGGQEAIYKPFVSIVTLVPQEVAGLGGCGCKAGEIVTQAAGESASIGFFRRLEIFFTELGEDEAVDFVAGAREGGRDGNGLRLNEGPPGGHLALSGIAGNRPLGTGFDPVADDCKLGVFQLACGRHDGAALAVHHQPQAAVFGFAGSDDAACEIARLIEAETGHCCASMTGIAILVEDRRCLLWQIFLGRRCNRNKNEIFPHNSYDDSIRSNLAK